MTEKTVQIKHGSCSLLAKSNVVLRMLFVGNDAVMYQCRPRVRKSWKQAKVLDAKCPK
jgi:hypothetical protein